MKKLFAACLVSCLALAGVARADDAKKDEKKDEKKAEKMEMPKPGPEHKKLGYFIGNWSMDGDMKPGPMGPGGKMTGSENCSWFDGRYAVVCKDSGTGPMGPMKGMGVITYDREDKMYEYFGIDSTGMSEKAEGKYENDSYVYTNEGKMNGKSYKGRYTMSNMKPDSYDFKYEMSEDGNTWNTVMEGKNTKKSAGGEKKPAAKEEKPAEKKK
jgi:uncharacterized protein DUF1579